MVVDDQDLHGGLSPKVAREGGATAAESTEWGRPRQLSKLAEPLARNAEAMGRLASC
jgi:hypothetical protein